MEANAGEEGAESSPAPSPQTENKENGLPLPFMGMKVRRRASLLKECHGDYVGVTSDPYLSKILAKQGNAAFYVLVLFSSDGQVLFADKVLRFTGSGKIKRRILLITDFAIYLIDSDSDVLKRRIALAAVEKLCVSELNDNFFAIIIPSEYDCLMASTRRTEIVDTLVEFTRISSGFELEILRSNRFEYNAAADMVKEVEFQEVNGNAQRKPAIG
ncbi:hypothetical protein AXF42_Ash014573 [Apostasia shenzhenica]|uniref:TH1 domain-containing protein n=1 Tax=Apostasia shenzhenica TaxID=1088818 RepID=A0A2I0AK34_9ASPA|nr:hypothetical protein AXF42_Ash014573 [Apostasia shenzhenica]